MNALFLGSSEDKSYLPYLKPMFKGLTTYVCLEDIGLLGQLEMYCVKRSITKVVSTNTTLLRNLLNRYQRDVESPALDDYAGSLFVHNSIEIVFVSPLKQIFTVSYGRFLCERFISKLTQPEKWREPTEFHWSLLDPGSCDSAYSRLESALFISVDIETRKSPLCITHVSYTGVWVSDSGVLSTHSYVLKIESDFEIAWMRKFNALAAPKAFQNGKYDNTYLLAYQAPVENWVLDTANMFHCWYSELGSRSLRIAAGLFGRSDLDETPRCWRSQFTTSSWFASSSSPLCSNHLPKLGSRHRIPARRTRSRPRSLSLSIGLSFSLSLTMTV